MEQLKPPLVTVARTESSLGSVHVELKGRLGNRILRRRLLQVGLFVAVWTVIAIAGSVHCYFSYASLGEPMSWPRAFALGMSLWYAWAILSVVIYQWTRFLPLGAGA